MDAGHRLHANTHTHTDREKVQKRRSCRSKRNNNHFSGVHFFLMATRRIVFLAILCLISIFFFFSFMKTAVFIIKTSVSCSRHTAHTEQPVWSADGVLMLTLFWSFGSAVLDLTDCQIYSVHTGLRDTHNYCSSAGDSGFHTTITLLVIGDHKDMLVKGGLFQSAEWTLFPLV